MSFSKIALALLPATLVAGVASAQPATTEPAPGAAAVQTVAPEKDDSINVSPLGLLFGNLYVTYERLFDGKHGLVIDAGGGFNNGDDSSESHGSVGVGYRWHWRGRQNSGFLGVMLHQSVGNGEVTVDDGSGPMSYEMSTRSTQVTANVGKRWMLGKDFNVTLRFGLGWGHHTVDAKSDSQDAQEAEEILNAALTFIPIGIDGELSVGYNF